MIQKHSRKLRSRTPQLEELRSGVLVQLGHTLNTWKVSSFKKRQTFFPHNEQRPFKTCQNFFGRVKS